MEITKAVVLTTKHMDTVYLHTNLSGAMAFEKNLILTFNTPRFMGEKYVIANFGKDIKIC